ncbi:hypothetical protein NLX83_13240 [Allokutzneria sp. A3M-2-11 16]|uniref:hypothetical protein n=1 Tax=Allokutzneria sp. A3M-2-11 16 TaxID=2962043 RepID=UPI0020B6AF21|nr:hypothetical protein [Allokutzneria sp. A3M-2-11 16]MCP3800224.1 hypothetical protein [Allokutzneria sp. A3M-2-11 16]
MDVARTLRLAEEMATLLLKLVTSDYPWKLHFFGPGGKDEPDVLAASLPHSHAQDVIVFHTAESAVAYRVPNHPTNRDRFEPATVSWWYSAPPAQVLQVLRALPSPGTPGEPFDSTTLPTHLRVPRWFRDNETVIPTPSKSDRR